MFDARQSLRPRVAGFACLLLVVSAASAAAQQTTVVTPGTTVSDRFYEYYGIGWGVSKFGPGGGFFFNNGGGAGVAPPFGGFDPNAGASFGFGGAGPAGAFHLNFSAAQGADRSITSTAPILTLPQGGFGSIQSGEWRPFVTGVTPVVGGGGGGGVRSDPLSERLQRMRAGETPGRRTVAPPPPSEERPAEATTSAAPIREADAASTAQRGDLSVREIRRRQAESRSGEDAEVAGLVARGEAAEAEGKPRIARVYYQQALRRAVGDAADELRRRLARLD